MNVVRCVVPIGLTVGALSAPLSAPAAGQQPACVTVRSGDTASGAARTLTGDGGNVAASWFYIVEPGGSRIPKTRYDTIPSGSRACVVARVTSLHRESWPAARASRPMESGRAVAFTTAELAMMWTALAFAGALMWRSVDGYLDRRETTLAGMKKFGERFVLEFERPLRELHRSGRPVRSELRAIPERGRLEIRLAPVPGHTYPNLADHRGNVAYDVGRVLDALGDPAFVRGPMYTHGSWVVVRFELRGAGRQAGGG